MTVSALMAKLRPFKDKPIIDCIDAITAIAEEMNYAVNVTDPTFNVLPIVKDNRRLNVRTDENSVITSFSIG